MAMPTRVDNTLFRRMHRPLHVGRIVGVVFMKDAVAARQHQRPGRRVLPGDCRRELGKCFRRRVRFMVPSTKNWRMRSEMPGDRHASRPRRRRHPNLPFRKLIAGASTFPRSVINAAQKQTSCDVRDGSQAAELAPGCKLLPLGADMQRHRVKGSDRPRGDVTSLL